MSNYLDILLCSTNSQYLYIADFTGELMQTFCISEMVPLERRKSVEGISIISAALSRTNKYLHLVFDNGSLYCFELGYKSGADRQFILKTELITVLPVQDSGSVLGIEVHPLKNVLSTFGTGGMRLWQ